MKQVNLFMQGVIFLILLIFSGCETQSYELSEEQGLLIESETESKIEGVLTFNEFIEITSKGFEGVGVDENYCFEFEFYDSSTDECVFEIVCDEEFNEVKYKTEDETEVFNELSECDRVDVIYDNFMEYLENQDYISADFSTHHHGTNENIDLINEFFINSDDTIELVKGEDINNIALSIWRDFSFLIPMNYREDLNYFGVFTDGVDETLAYVAQRDFIENPHIWYLAIDYEDFNSQSREEFYATLIHEFAHIFSLDNSQLDYFGDENTCIYLYIDEGCFYENSYLQLFYEQFWENGLYTEHLELVEQLGSQEEASYELFMKYEEDFVSEYAATNILEDFAESYMMYILFSYNQVKESSNTISKEKIMFFDQFTELRNLRVNIRNNLEKLSRTNS